MPGTENTSVDKTLAIPPKELTAQLENPRSEATVTIHKVSARRESSGAMEAQRREEEGGQGKLPGPGNTC